MEIQLSTGERVCDGRNTSKTGTFRRDMQISSSKYAG